MVWGCIAFNGVGNITVVDGHMTARSSVEILRRQLRSSAVKLGLENNFNFQQDNDPKHTAHITKEWLLYNAPRRLITPPQSPDLNPIKNLWHLLDEKIRKKLISGKKGLGKTYQE